MEQLERRIKTTAGLLADRQLVDSCVQQTEINPDDKTGVVLHADLESVLLSTRVVGGDNCVTQESQLTAARLRLFFRQSCMSNGSILNC